MDVTFACFEILTCYNVKPCVSNSRLRKNPDQHQRGFPVPCEEVASAVNDAIWEVPQAYFSIRVVRIVAAPLELTLSSTNPWPSSTNPSSLHPGDRKATKKRAKNPGFCKPTKKSVRAVATVVPSPLIQNRWLFAFYILMHLDGNGNHVRDIHLC